MNEMDGALYCAEEITDGVWSIGENGVHSFLIEGLNKAMLVDTGMGKGDIKSFAKSLTKLPIFLVNTHADIDHIGCNESFEKVMMHPAEVNNYQMQKPGNYPVIEFIEEGDIIDLGCRQFEIIHIPGHTPGSIALFDRKNKLLISGDSVQSGAVFLFGEGRDIGTYIESMRKLEKMAADFETILASHGETTVSADIITELIKGAERVLKGEIEGKTPPVPINAKLYIAGRAKFLYNRPSKE